VRSLLLPPNASPREWGRIHGEHFRGEIKALSAITQAPTNNTVHITADYWSAPHGSQLPGTIALDLTVPSKRCTGPASCSFIATTQTSSTTIDVP